jgi:hypothetical protein
VLVAFSDDHAFELLYRFAMKFVKHDDMNENDHGE